jgi:hypothetical protein
VLLSFFGSNIPILEYKQPLSFANIKNSLVKSSFKVHIDFGTLLIGVEGVRLKRKSDLEGRPRRRM